MKKAYALKQLVVLLSLRRGFPERKLSLLESELFITSQGEAVRPGRMQIHPSSTGSLGSGTSG